MTNEENAEIKAFIERALKEDIGSGDHTSLATVPADAQGAAQLLVKENGILAGVEVARKVFELVDPQLRLSVFIEDGSHIKKGDIAFRVEGKSQSILTAERLALNFMQRMSGIATKTNSFVKLVEDLPVKILDTRKTTPNLRIFEKWAVRLGGGANHRIGLYDMILIKDNHVDFCGGIAQAIESVQKYLTEKNLDLPIEIETRNIEEVKQVLNKGGVDRIMLDNYTFSDMREAVKLINKKYETEASGNVNLQTVRGYAETGVDFISVGAITHSAVALDLSLKAV